MAAEDGIRVETVTIKDDVTSSENFEDRRGVAGDIFVLKVAAAAAAKGYDLDKVKELAEKANRATYSMGIALSSGSLPVTGQSSTWRKATWKLVWVSTVSQDLKELN